MFHVKHEAWGSWADALELQLGPEQISLLERYESLLASEALKRGLIARDDADRLRERHIVDSIRAAPCLPGAPAVILDMGSGAGLPGIPLAVARRDLRFVLAEGRRARAAFLESVIDRLRLPNVGVHPGTVETAAPGFEACLARAFAPARVAWAQADRVLGPSGRLLYWAGAAFVPEEDGPPGVSLTLFRSPALANAGPVVIMARQ